MIAPCEELNSNFYINALYRATEGEGILVGTPQIFVRFQGCSIHCVNCDSKETWKFSKEPTHTLEELMISINTLALPVSVINPKLTSLGHKTQPINRVSITGGDPLDPIHQKPVLSLIKELNKIKMTSNIEAAGNSIVDSIFDEVDYISFDFKTPSDEIQSNLDLVIELAKKYPQKFQIKSVIADKEDFNYTYSSLLKLQQKIGTINFPWCLTPAYSPSEIFPKERFTLVQLLNEEFGGPFRVIGQQHKWIHGPNKREV